MRNTSRMNDHNTNAQSIWESAAAWVGLGVTVTLADALLEAFGRKPKPKKPNQKTTNNNQEKEENK
jgi:hypothetical protein